MLGSKYTITNQDDVSIDFNDYTQSATSFIVLTAYPQFNTDIKNYEIQKEGQHGIWDFYSYYGKRILSFQGKIVGDTEALVHTRKELLETVLKLPVQPTSADDGTVTLQWIDPSGNTKQIDGKLMSSIKYNRKMSNKNQLDFSVNIKCPDPFFEDVDYTVVSGLRGYAMGSVQLPVTYTEPIAWVKEQQTTVNNTGSVLADTTIRIYGNDNHNITNPRIDNFTTSKFIKINSTIVGTNNFIVIQSDTGTVQDQNGTDLSGLLEVGSELLKLAVGSNTLYYTADENTNSHNPIATRITPDEIMTVDFKPLTV